MRWLRQGQASKRRAARRANDRGLKFSATGRFAEALPEFERAVELVPTDLSARVNLGSVYYNLAMAREQGPLPAWLDEAARHFLYVLGIDRDHVLANLNLAATYHAQKRHQEALDLLVRLERERPHHPDVAYNLAIAHLQLGDETAAREALERELGRDARHQRARELLARLDQER